MVSPRTIPITMRSPATSRPSATAWRRGLAEIGFGVVPCAGTYFITADVAPLGLTADDAALCEKMTVEAGVTAVPVSAFYQSDAPKSFVRFCFSKRDEVLDAALDRLGRWVADAT